MKSLLRSLAPDPVVAGYRRLKDYVADQRARDRSAEEVFTAIYDRKQWGGATGDAFCSGTGSTSDACVDPYVEAVLARIGGAGPRPAAVDLGCGDFRVGRRLLPALSAYTGIDVVRPLVERNQREFGGPTTRFVHLDITRDPLPAGDVCFVRQVLQHLSNAQIAAVLAKLAQYPLVIVTEHYPSADESVVPNVDKVHGRGTRLGRRSGVYLTAPPFAISEDEVTEILCVPAPVAAGGGDPGVLRTFAYRPRAAARRAGA